VEVISINGINKYDQHAASPLYGSGFAASTSGVSPNGFNLTVMPASTLPVLFNSFYANRRNNNVVLTWSTSMEQNNNNFEVQRSVDGSNWVVVAIVLGAGNSNSLQQYSHTDKNVTTTVAWYRIRQVDMDGRYTYSTVKTIRANETTPATRIYASRNTVNIEFNREVLQPVTIRVINMNGQVIAQRDHQQASYRVTMPVNNTLAGAYFVQVNDNAGFNEVRKVIF
jgi:hypothetical protein